MKITKLGHACLIIEESDLTMVLDPGVYSTVPELSRLDLILVTHDHADHCDPEQIQTLLTAHPNAEVITNEGTGTVLADKGIPFTVIADGERIEHSGVAIESYGTKHDIIYKDLPMTSQNTGYRIADRFFYPGDAFHIPPQPVEILALPLGGPWMKLGEAIDYAKAVTPKVVIPVHDGVYNEHSLRFTRMLPRTILEPLGVEFRDMNPGSVEEFN